MSLPADRMTDFALMLADTASQSTGGAAFVVLTTKPGPESMSVALATSAKCSPVEREALLKLTDALTSTLDAWLELNGYRGRLA